MKPEELLHPMILQAVKRYISYRWDNGIIQDLVRFRFNVRLSAKCLKAIRNDESCTEYCRSHCVLK